MITFNVNKVLWFYGVMVSTLDFESSDPSSNLGGTCILFLRVTVNLVMLNALNGLYISKPVSQIILRPKPPRGRPVLVSKICYVDRHRYSETGCT